MREILFRGKRKDGNGWVYGHYHNTTYIGYPNGGDNKTTEHYILPQNAVNACAVIPSTVGQYTGLCDKNGKKIFEGDILATRTGRPRIVKFEDGGFALTDTAIPIRHAKVFEVIGNIHDNPELLEVSHE